MSKLTPEAGHIRKLIDVLKPERSTVPAEEIAAAEAELIRVASLGLNAAGNSRWTRVKYLGVVIAAVCGTVLFMGSETGERLARAGYLPFLPPTSVGRFGLTEPTVETQEEQILLKLRRIRLPASPTRRDAVEYKDAVLGVAANQTSYGGTDLQVRMLMDLAVDFMDVLLADQSSNSYVHWAIVRGATEKHRDVIVKAFERDLELADVIVSHHWTDDVREVLLREMNREKDYYPVDFIQAVAGMKEPSTYPSLLKYLEQGANPARTVEAIQDLPGADVGISFERAWKRAQSTFGYERDSLIGEAMRRGYVDAVTYAARVLETHITNPPRENDVWKVNSAREALVKYCSIAGSDAELVAWCKTNSANLTFNQGRRRFEVLRPRATQEGVATEGK